MATVEFRNEQDGSTFEPSGAEVRRVKSDIVAWAKRNEYDRIVFWRDGDKLWVQLGDSRLNYWMPEHVFASAGTEEIEMQLDYARGAERRGAVGYGKFDK
ncbi:hypothetical protein [Deinococcus pimensis]|uniref:hypothetical protein n=1 Tax=Deinococcus pimensis TaxID=309888 RepID=UPI000482B14D|nr:hypothetical protein [Deinococcus pimensis]